MFLLSPPPPSPYLLRCAPFKLRGEMLVKPKNTMSAQGGRDSKSLCDSKNILRQSKFSLSRSYTVSITESVSLKTDNLYLLCLLTLPPSNICELSVQLSLEITSGGVSINWNVYFILMLFKTTSICNFLIPANKFSPVSSEKELLKYHWCSRKHYLINSQTI